MPVAIFDMDGLLIDSEPLWRQAEIEIFARCGVALTEEMCSQTMGLRIDEVVAWWFERFPWQDRGQGGESQAAVAGDIVERVRQLLEAEASALPGVYDILKRLCIAGWRLALASSSPPILIETAIRKLGLGETFEILGSASEEKLGKPHPAVYLTVAGRLGVQPSCCLAFEDSIAGMRSALAAGMRVVVVPAPQDYERPEFDLATHRLRSLADFDVAGISR